MEATLEQQIKSAVLDWASLAYRTQEIIVGSAAQDGAEDHGAGDSDADRYLVDYAVRAVGRWLVAEVWLTGQEIFSINDLGEGLPLDDIRWPWAIDETP
jgi:hypothetical protein